MVNQQLFPPFAPLLQTVSELAFLMQGFAPLLLSKVSQTVFTRQRFSSQYNVIIFLKTWGVLCLFMCAYVAMEGKSHIVALFEEIRPKPLYGISLYWIPKGFPPSASHQETQLGTKATEYLQSFTCSMKHFWEAV